MNPIVHYLELGRPGIPDRPGQTPEGLERLVERFHDVGQLEEKAAQVETKIDRLIDLEMELGNAKRTATKIREPGAQADDLKRSLVATQISPDDLRQAARKAIDLLRPALLESPQQARATPQQPLENERLFVYPDRRIQGTAQLPIMLRGVGAGDRTRNCKQWRLSLEIQALSPQQEFLQTLVGGESRQDRWKGCEASACSVDGLAEVRL